MEEKKSFYCLPWGYCQIIQDRLQKQGILISKSMIQKVRSNARENLSVRRELKKLSNEYSKIKAEVYN
jgi:predicted metal-dependent HD superfamily phosphohydrolase